jgi:hypothetical protein
MGRDTRLGAGIRFPQNPCSICPYVGLTATREIPSAPQGGNKFDVHLHCIFRSGDFDRSPSIEFGAPNEVEAFWSADSFQSAAALKWCEWAPQGRVSLTADLMLRDAPCSVASMPSRCDRSRSVASIA